MLRAVPALDPATLRASYAAFLAPGRVLLTGHSHQAWPDAARAGLLRAWDDAARLADDKWGPAMEAADAVRANVAARLGGDPADVALAANTHELVTRFLSALDWSRGKHLVTTAGEFHSIRRQLGRLAEEGVEVEAVPVQPLDTLAARLAEAVRDDTVALLASTVLFETSSVVPGLKTACEAAHARGAAVLLDSYHDVGALPWRPVDPEAFVVGGGYKYLQWGEGCCFMRVPAGCALRPVYTGWFADFAHLAAPQGGRIGYGERGGERFAGSTYDPISHYRARAVIDFFRDQGMTPEALRALSLAQTEHLMNGLEGYEVLTPRADEARGGFVTVRVTDASAVVKALREEDVVVDARGDKLRFGPAPYVTEDELDRALAAFRRVCPPDRAR
ncbi:MAG: kynureninase [Sandaracinus sp.]|nr:kynureninase [Myxococcales bacterium]MAT29374.1 kynureninase [Sandaracinus sp.]MBJ72161.1 kynureninase [Sandaracinus sp.]